MDSLTQIALGAAVGELCMGKKIGNKALLLGAIGGTIPDLDVFIGHFLDDLTRIEIHRGFSHSILFCIIFSPIFAWLTQKLFFKTKDYFKDLCGLFFWSLFTHPLLDAHTSWGTQLFWPLSYKVAYNNIFVVDFFYTLPILVSILLILKYHRSNTIRKKRIISGLALSSMYMLFTIASKVYGLSVFENNLNHQAIEYSAISTRPSPLNAILWNANIMQKDSVCIGNYSLFDSNQDLVFYRIAKDHHLLGDLKDHPKINRLRRISKDWFSISKEQDTLYFNDLRFGQLGMEKSAPFVFRYKLIPQKNGDLQVLETVKHPKDVLPLLSHLFKRIIGQKSDS